jgi:hypothetical protein
MTGGALGKFVLGILLLTLPLLACAGISQDISQEIKDDRREAREQMAEAEKNYESHQYFGLTSEKSDQWNATDWSLWMDTHGGGGR